MTMQGAIRPVPWPSGPQAGVGEPSATPAGSVGHASPGCIRDGRFDSAAQHSTALRQPGTLSGDVDAALRAGTNAYPYLTLRACQPGQLGAEAINPPRFPLPCAPFHRGGDDMELRTRDGRQLCVPMGRPTGEF